MSFVKTCLGFIRIQKQFQSVSGELLKAETADAFSNVNVPLKAIEDILGKTPNLPKDVAEQIRLAMQHSHAAALNIGETRIEYMRHLAAALEKAAELMELGVIMAAANMTPVD